MSLSPSNLFNVGSSALPTLFLEARIHSGTGSGQAEELITQLGLSLTSGHVDVAVFTRTSGIVLVAGVGSYCAYRICAKYLGKEFVWTLMDAVRLDRISHADSRLLHPAAEGYLSPRQNSTFYEERARQRLFQLLRSLSEDDKIVSASGSSGHASPSVSHAGSEHKQRYRLLSTRSGSPIRVICASSSMLKRAMQKAGADRNHSNEAAEGLSAIRWETPERTKDLTLSTRKHFPLLSDDDRCDALSDLTSVSRIQPPPTALFRTNCCVDVDGDLILNDQDEDSDENSSRRSMYGGESLIWDDEFLRSNAGSAVTNLLFHCDSSSNISELSAIKNLEAMWAINDGKHNRADSSAASLIRHLNENIEDDAASSICPNNLAQLIESKCSISASYMYQSVHLDEDLTSVVSNQSVLSANFRATLNDSHDPWELTSPSSRPIYEKDYSSNRTLYPIDSEPSTSRIMSDSYASKSSSSSRSQKKSAMFDSAIGTDFMSSDDDKSSLHGHTVKRQLKSGVNEEPKKHMQKRSWLDKINEKPSPQHRRISVAQSEQSMEWFDELSNQQQNLSIKDKEEGTPI